MYNYKPRTYQGVEAQLTSKVSNYTSSLGDPYLSCRYFPFAAMGHTGPIPDGRGINVVQRDWKQAFDFVAATSGFQIRISPIFPYCVRIYQPSGSITVGGTTVSSVAAAVSSGVVLDTGAMTTGAIPPSGGVNNMGNVVAGRIQTIGYRLVYTGQAASAQGLLVVDELGFKLDMDAPSNSSPIAYNNGASGPATPFAAGTTPVALCDSLDFSSTGYITRRQVVTRPENGVYGVLKARETARSHRFKPWWEYMHMVVKDAASPAVGSNWSALGSYLVANSLPAPYAALIDDALGEVNINVTLPGSYRLEVVLCMEQDLDPTSSMIDMAKPSPPWNEMVLRADDYLNSMIGPVPADQPLIPQATRPKRVRRSKAANNQPVRTTGQGAKQQRKSTQTKRKKKKSSKKA